MKLRPSARSTRGSVPLGALGVAGYAIHIGYHVWEGHPEDAFWICHLAALAVGVGLLLGRPRISAAGLLCLAVGTPIWILDLLAGEPFLPTSLLTHALGPALGLVAARRMGLPRRSWLAAWALVATGFAAALLFTPAAMNVNVAFGPLPIWAHAPSYWPFHIAWLMGFWGATLLASELALRRLGFGERARA